jgi:hypothetical protein
MHESWLHILITLVAIPGALWAFSYFIIKKDEKVRDALKQADDLRTKNLDDWHKTIIDKISGYCVSNREEHEQLYNARNNHEGRLTSIETIHHQKGCDQPSYKA